MRRSGRCQLVLEPLLEALQAADVAEIDWAFDIIEQSQRLKLLALFGQDLVDVADVKAAVVADLNSGQKSSSTTMDGPLMVESL